MLSQSQISSLHSHKQTLKQPVAATNIVHAGISSKPTDAYSA